VPTSRELMLTALQERIAWFREAPRQGTAAGLTGADIRRPRPRLHTLAHLALSNRDHEDVLLRPTMWMLFDV
jgi:hypothetical protein